MSSFDVRLFPLPMIYGTLQYRIITRNISPQRADVLLSVIANAIHRARSPPSSASVAGIFSQESQSIITKNSTREAKSVG